MATNPEGFFVLDTDRDLALNQMGDSPNPPSKDYFKIYKEQSGLLRTWFVGFGVAVPVLCFTNQYMTPNVSLHGHPALLSCFLSGVAVQVVLAFINKHMMWAMYYGSIDSSFRKTRRYRCAEAVSRWYGIGFALDAATLALFAVATGKLLSLLTN